MGQPASDLESGKRIGRTDVIDAVRLGRASQFQNKRDHGFDVERVAVLVRREPDCAARLPGRHKLIHDRVRVRRDGHTQHQRKADDDSVGEGGKDRFFGESLGAAVDVKGGGWMVFVVGGAGAVEDRAGGGKDHTGARIPTGAGHIFGTAHVDGFGQAGITLAAIDVGDCRQVRDQVRTGAIDGALAGCLVGDIDAGVGGRDIEDLGRQAGEPTADEPARAEDQQCRA